MKKKIGSALVVGAGISGIRSALDLAEQGYRVTLIDRAPHLGGTLAQLDYQFPSDHCGMCKMLPVVERDSASQFCLRKGLFHENVDIMLATELVALEGEPGKFLATLRHKPTHVNPDSCIGCGECSRVCPISVPDEFNAGLTMRKAIYLPVPHNIPNHYVVDVAACTRCGECEKICPTGAIDLLLEARRAYRVLVVDDELIVRDSIKEWLEDEGFSVDMAESGLEALEKLSSQDYNLMLLDVKMPGMDGVEVLKRAKELRPELNVVMMTAYATVETAVEAMKIGALDYLMKPFDPEALVSMVVQLYRSHVRIGEQQIEVGAVILAAGFGTFDPSSANDTYDYKELPDVVTSIEFERIVSGTGPTQGELKRPSNGKEIKKIAWLQCVGSRNLQADADYCSSVCCMFSIKEALLAKERSQGEIETAIFYMDMRTFGKDFQRYRDLAEDEHGVRFVRSRVHSVEREPDSEQLKLRYSTVDGTVVDEFFDLVVLATGQRPPRDSESLAELAEIELNSFGFTKLDDFSLARTSREGVYVSGSFSGLRDISESVIQAGSASFEASSFIHSKGGGLAEVSEEDALYRDVSKEIPRVAVALCTCSGAVSEAADLRAVVSKIQKTAAADEIFQVERLCTQQGWEELQENLRSSKANRVLIAACMPYVYAKKFGELGRSVGLHPSLMDVVDVRTPTFPGGDENRTKIARNLYSLLSMGIGRLRGVDPYVPAAIEVFPRALVVGGGIAGMTAALGIADHGYQVDLVERQAQLGGNLRKLYRTFEGGDPQKLLEETIARVENHPNITLHTEANVLHSIGQIGRFVTTIEKQDGSPLTVEHAVTILATGGKEAETESYGYGQSEAIVTQHELEGKLQNGAVDPARLGVVAMIQCVGSREEPRNYCSRVCCASALNKAIFLKEQNPETDIYVFYRDIMTYGFLESIYTKARQAGVIFVQYDTANKPSVEITDGVIHLAAYDPILGRQIALRPDLVVLSTGIVPFDNGSLAELFGVEISRDGFFVEAESKWRPVDFIKEGIFVCGIAHSPRSIAESIAMAEAAVQRALPILTNQRLIPASVIAEVRHSLCSLCEQCIAACPYGARWLNEEEEKVMVDEITCQGCGSCAAVCPNSASVLRGHKDQQIFAVLDGALEEIF